MEVNRNTYQQLLSDIARVMRHQKEIAILKGETFNIFSILKMENLENKTHSAFIGELLNPKGSHRMGMIFLKSFLKQVGLKKHIELNTAKVVLEKSIGKRNDNDETGGRVDIFIFDDIGNTLCIENKIYASDQNVQIARYCNFNIGKNKVIYLNLEGDSPSEQSYNNKKIDKDFSVISYRNDILKWLEKSQKESVRLPILRESINQYAILIKKLTNQLSDNKMEKEVKDLIIKNYKAAQTIKSTIGFVEEEYATLFINEIVKTIKNRLDPNWIVKGADNLNQTWTGIIINHREWSGNISIKLEGASKIPWNPSIYGVKAPKDKYDRNVIKQAMQKIDFFNNNGRESDVWPWYKNILEFQHSSNREILFNTNDRGEFVKEVSDKLMEICLACEISFKNL